MKKRLLLIGCGQWSHSSHLPALMARASQIETVFLYDEEQCQARKAQEYLNDKNGLTAIALQSPEAEIAVDGVIIATPPVAHFEYAKKWAERGIPVLIDKPVVVTPSCSTNTDAAKEILRQMDVLTALTKNNRNPKFFMMVGVQKRFQEVYQRIAEQVRSIHSRTGYPPTRIRVFTNDGYWILPEEFATLKYHGYHSGRGGGKITHTGYHFLDIVPWIMRHAEGAYSRISHAWITGTFFRPADSVQCYRQSKLSGLEGIPEGLDGQCEINAKLAVRFCEPDEHVVCDIDFDFQHEGFSLRDYNDKSPEAKIRGRIKMDQIQIDMGPFAEIRFERTAKIIRENGIVVGGAKIGQKQHYQLIRIVRDMETPEGQIIPEALATNCATSCEQEPQANSNDLCDVDQRPTLEFLETLLAPSRRVQSSLADHEIPMKLMAGAYLAAATEYETGEPKWIRVVFSREAMQIPVETG